MTEGALNSGRVRPVRGGNGQERSGRATRDRRPQHYRCTINTVAKTSEDLRLRDREAATFPQCSRPKAEGNMRTNPPLKLLNPRSSVATVMPFAAARDTR